MTGLLRPKNQAGRRRSSRPTARRPASRRPSPRYPAGGAVGAAALSAILRGLRVAHEELSGLREQLEQNAQAARRVGGPGKPETLCVFAPWPQSY